MTKILVLALACGAGMAGAAEPTVTLAPTAAVLPVQLHHLM